jgi:hypothetical protein
MKELYFGNRDIQKFYKEDARMVYRFVNSRATSCISLNRDGEVSKRKHYFFSEIAGYTGEERFHSVKKIGQPIKQSPVKKLLIESAAEFKKFLLKLDINEC